MIYDENWLKGKYVLTNISFCLTKGHCGSGTYTYQLYELWYTKKNCTLEIKDFFINSMKLKTKKLILWQVHWEKNRESFESRVSTVFYNWEEHY